MIVSSGKDKKSSKINFHLNFKGLRIDDLKFKGKDFMLPFQHLKYRNGVSKERGTHFCVPIFGKPPKGSSLAGKIPQHGFLRDIRVSLKRINGNESSAEAKFKIPQTEGYPWEIIGRSLFKCDNTGLSAEISLRRSWACRAKDLAPINIGFHPYWVNEGGVSVFTKNYNGPIDRLIIPSYHIEYLGPINVKIHGVGNVVMEMEGDLKDPEIVMWTDHPSFACIELVAANSRKFGTEEGVMLDKGEEMSTKFILQFSNNS